MQTVTPFLYSGWLQVPYSKSYLQRAIAIGLLSKRSVEIQGFTPGNDAIAARSIAMALGAKTTLKDGILHMEPATTPLEKVTIHCGESGLSTRMFSPIAASLSKDVRVEGEGSINVRPMDMVIDALEKLGAEVTSNQGKLPLHITRGIQGGSLEIDGSESSQLLTGLLIALSFTDEKSEVVVHDLKSIPYVQMTLDILEFFGVSVQHSNYRRFTIPKYQNVKEPIRYAVEGDWSGASFHIVGAAISGEILLKGLNVNSAQADKAVIEAVKMAGANVEWRSDDLFVAQGELNAFSFDATHCPDLFPPLAALAACCQGTSEIRGVSRLASKESNRGLTIQSELRKLGIEVVLDGDLMRITGANIQGGTIDSNNDHRIAMMGAILATKSSDSISINDAKAVDKSYPLFFEDITKIAAAT